MKYLWCLNFNESATKTIKELVQIYQDPKLLGITPKTPICFKKMSSAHVYFVVNDRFNLMCPPNHVFYFIWGRFALVNCKKTNIPLINVTNSADYFAQRGSFLSCLSAGCCRTGANE